MKIIWRLNIQSFPENLTHSQYSTLVHYSYHIYDRPQFIQSIELFYTTVFPQSSNRMVNYCHLWPMYGILSGLGSHCLHCLTTQSGIISRLCTAKLLLPPAWTFLLRYLASSQAPQFFITDQNRWYSLRLWVPFTHFGSWFLSGHHNCLLFSWTTQGAQKQSGHSASPSLCLGRGKWSSPYGTSSTERR